MSAKLYIVATPIGNLDDITQRAIEVLKNVDFIAAEDTRHTKRLCNHLNITTPLVAFHDYSSDGAVNKLLERINNGESCALVSDAGTPLISDPGYILVKRCHVENISVVPIPGACAAIAALSASGLPSDRFSFEGFLPSKSGQRINILQKLIDERRTMIFYEAPHRILNSLKDLLVVFGESRMVTMAREVTKTFETIKTCSLTDMIEFVEADSNQQRGEIVMIVSGAEDVVELDTLSKQAMRVLKSEFPPKRAAQLVSEITGVKPKVLYQWALTDTD